MKLTKSITEQDYIVASRLLKCEVEVIKAVDLVESNGSGFLISGEPKILFEGHVFWRELQKVGILPSKFEKGNENILYRKWTNKHYVGGRFEHQKLGRAISINRNAALSSASWGRYQIMGYNYEVCGFKTIQEFVNAMYENEGRHLFAFINFVKNNKLEGYLQTKNWSKFAEGYNGSGYKVNKYDEKLENAYKRLKKN